jgi:hypothetical protein
MRMNSNTTPYLNIYPFPVVCGQARGSHKVSWHATSFYLLFLALHSTNEVFLVWNFSEPGISLSYNVIPSASRILLFAIHEMRFCFGQQLGPPGLAFPKTGVGHVYIPSLIVSRCFHLVVYVLFTTYSTNFQNKSFSSAENRC